jgi:hypothetical protein
MTLIYFQEFSHKLLIDRKDFYFSNFDSSLICVTYHNFSGKLSNYLKNINKTNEELMICLNLIPLQAFLKIFLITAINFEIL